MASDKNKTRQELIAELNVLRRHLSSDHRLHSSNSDTPSAAPSSQWLSRTALALLRLSTRREIIDFAGPTLTEHLGNCVTVVLSAEPGDDSLRIEGIFGLNQDLLTQALSLFDGGLLGQSFPVEPRFEAAYAELSLCHHDGGLSKLAGNAVPRSIIDAIERLLNLHDVYTMALVGQDRVLGNLHILTRAPAVVEDGDLIEIFAHQVALAMERASAAESLARKEERLSALFDHAADAILVAKPDGTIIQVNERACHSTGYPEHELLSLNIIDINAGLDGRQDLRHLLDDLSADQPVTIESQHRRRDGSTLPVEVKITRLDTAEGPRILAIARDSTERIHAQEALRQSQGNLKAILDSTEQSFVLLDRTYRIEAFNQTAARNTETVFGLSMGRGQSIFQYVLPRDEESFKEHFKQALRGQRVQVEKPFPGGRWFSFTFNPIWDDGGNITGICFNATDITQRKEATAALQASEEAYRSLVERAPMGVFTSTSRGELIDVNTHMAQILGYEDKEGALQAYYDLGEQLYLDPRRREALLEELREHGSVERFEYRAYHREGHQIWLQMSARVSRENPDGTFVIEGFSSDITQRKEAEAARRESEERYRRLVEGSPDIHYVYSSKRGALFWSERVRDLLGYAPDALKDDPYMWHDAIHPDDLPVVDRLIGSFDEGTADFDIEYRIQDREGDWHWFHDRCISKRRRGDELLIEGLVTDITERKRAQQALRHSEERYRRVLDTMNEGLATMDKTGRFTYVNDAFCTMLGYTPEELLRCSHLEVVAPSRREEHRQYFADRKRGEARVFETLLCRKDGETIPVILAGTPVLDEDGEFVGTVGAVTDITERKRAEEALRESETFLRQVIDTSPNCVFVKDWDGRYLLVNDTIAALYQTPKDEMLGKTDPELAGVDKLGPEEAEQFVADDREVITSGEPKLIREESFTLADGSTRWFQTVKVPLAAGFGQHCMLGVAADITERKEMEEQLRQQERLAAVGQLAGGIAHDFNNLLASIILYAQMPLNDPDLAPSTGDALNTILEESHRAADLVQQILDFGRSAMMEVKPVNLEGLVDDAVALLRRTIPEDISLSTAFVAGPTTIEADATRIHQVLMNLALNAKDAMPDGGVLHIEVEPLALASDADRPFPEMHPGPWVRLTVSDSGTGMTEEVQSHLFEPFFTTKEVDEGTGLGLAQVYGIIKQHEGFIDVETAVGEGTIFRIFLPCVTSPQVPHQSEVEPPARKGTETILVVEDADPLRRAIRAALESLGYCILLAVDGRDALQALSEQDVDLVLTDVVMPQMGGQALLQALRREHPYLKVVAMTGHVFDQDPGALKDSGFNDALPKPFSIADLTQTVRAVLDE